MTDHLHYIKNAVLKSLPQLKQDLETSIAGTGDPLGPNTLDVRQASMVFDHTPVVVRRVYIQVNDSSALSSVGWVTNESMNCCMECLKTFSLFTRRHHCRACGAVNCSECSNSWTVLRDFGDLGTVRGEPEVRLQNNISWGESILSKSESSKDDKSGHDSRLARLGLWARLSMVSRDSAAAAGSTPISPISVIAAAAEQAAAEYANVERIATLRREEDAEVIEAAHAALAEHPQTVRLVPFPGFVIKTHRRNHEESKVFINVFHHTSVKDPHLMLTYLPYDATLIAKAHQTQAASSGSSPSTAPNTHDSAAAHSSSTAPNGAASPNSPVIQPVPLVTPLVYVAVDRSCTQDKEGYVSLLYNVLVSSAYFERTTVAETDMHVAHPCSVNKIIQIVNQRYKDNLYEDHFVMPKVRMRYHGQAITKPIPFQRADVPVRYVDISQLCYTAPNAGTGGSVAGGDDASTVASPTVSGPVSGPVSAPVSGPVSGPLPSPPAQVPPMISRHNSAGKLPRLSNKGRVSPCVTAGGVTSFKDTPEPDELSIVSDITVASNLSTSDAVFVRERRRFAFTKSRHVRGETVITDEMLRLNARQTMSIEASSGLKDQSLADPSILIGYQIVMPYNQEVAAAFDASRSVPMIDPSFIYVIIDTAKNNLRKTEYKVTNHLSGDSWVKLKRAKGKQGVEFRILRKVLQDLPPLVSPATSAKTPESPIGIAGGFGGFGVESDGSGK